MSGDEYSEFDTELEAELGVFDDDQSIGELGLDEDDDDSLDFGNAATVSRHDRLKQHALKAHLKKFKSELSKVQDQVTETQLKVQKSEAISDELRDQLEEIRNALDAYEENPPRADNVQEFANMKRLRERKAKLEGDIMSQDKHTLVLDHELETLTRTLNQYKLQESRQAEVERQLEEADVNEAKYRAFTAKGLLEREQKIAQRVVTKQHERAKLLEERTRKEAETRRQQDAENAAARARAEKLMKETRAKVAQKKEVEEQRKKVEEERVVANIMTLKASRDALAKKDEKKAKEKLKKQEEERLRHEQERKEILSVGGNPELVFRQREKEAQARALQEETDRKKRENEENARKKIAFENTQRQSATQRLNTAASQGTTRPPLTASSTKKSIRVERSKRSAAKLREQVEQSRISAVAEGESSSDEANGSENEEEQGSKSAKGNHSLPSASKVSPNFLDFSENLDYGYFGQDAPLYLEDDDEGLFSHVHGVEDKQFGDAWTDFENNMGYSFPGNEGEQETSVDDHWADTLDNESEALASRMKATNGGSTFVPDQAMSKKLQSVLQRHYETQKSSSQTIRTAMGNESGGEGFVSRPGKIVFEDFDVGGTYKKKVVFINRGASPNSFRPIESLHHAISFEFAPKGLIYAGLSCEMTVVFVPTRNEAVDSAITLLDHNGVFSLPIECLPKKVNISVDLEEIAFGTMCVQDEAFRTITIKNGGAIDGKVSLKIECAEEQVCFGIALKANKAVSPVYETSLSDVLVPSKGAVTVCLRTNPLSVGSHKASLIILPAQSESMHVPLSVTCSDVDVFVETPVIDFLVCEYGDTYSAPLIIQAKGGLQASYQFNIPPEFRPYIEVVPASATIAPKSSCSVLVKFSPRADIFDVIGNVGDADSGLLSLPLELLVAKQPVPGKVEIKAHVTHSHIVFSHDSLQFGTMTYLETLCTPITLTNMSALPQPFGFIGLPPYVSVQPGFGFGTLLPFESLSLDVLLSPPPPDEDEDAENYSKNIDFKLTCKWKKDQQIVVCSATVVSPPVSFSSSRLFLRATPLGDTSSTRVTLRNTSSIAKCFSLAPSCDGDNGDLQLLSISPRYGELPPNGQVDIVVTFSPPFLPPTLTSPQHVSSFEPNSLGTHAVPNVTLDTGVPDARQTKEEGQSDNPLSKQGGKENATSKDVASTQLAVPPSQSGSGTPKTSPSRHGSGRKFPENDSRFITPSPEKVVVFNTSVASKLQQEEKSPEQVLEGLRELISHCVVSRVLNFSVACFTADAYDDVSPFTRRNAVYLEIEAPVVPPSLVFDDGAHSCVLDFGLVPVDDHAVRKIAVWNLADVEERLFADPLSLDGPYSLASCLRALAPRSLSNPIAFVFQPKKGGRFNEKIILRSKRGGQVEVRLTGEAHVASYTISPSEPEVVFGDYLVGHTGLKSFTISNTSSFPLPLKVTLLRDSPELSSKNLLRQQRDEGGIAVKTTFDPIHGFPVVHRGGLSGTQNISGSEAFSFSITDTNIPPSSSIEVVATFQPDHASRHYMEHVVFSFGGLATPHIVCLRGRCSARSMYIRGPDDVDRLTPESLSCIIAQIPPPPTSPPEADTDAEIPPLSEAYSVFLTASLKDLMGGGKITKELVFGLARFSVPKTEKKKPSGDFMFDTLSASDTGAGFSLSMLKGAVDHDSPRTTILTYAPPKPVLQSLKVGSSVLCTLRVSMKSEVLVVASITCSIYISE